MCAAKERFLVIVDVPHFRSFLGMLNLLKFLVVFWCVFGQFSFSRRIPMVSYSCLRSSLSFPLFNITNPIVNEAIVTGFGEVVCTIAFLISHFRSVLQLQNQFVVIRNARRMRAF